DYKSSWSGMPYTLRIGRQQLDLGSERMVSSLDWENTSRVFDGVLLSMGSTDDWTLDIFATRAVAVRPSNFNDWEKTGNRYVDSDFHGLYYSNWKMLSNTRWDAYLFLRDQDDIDDKVWTIGTRTESNWGLWDGSFEFAYQTGDFGTGIGLPDLDHRAWMLNLGFGYQPEWMANSRIGLAYSWATGDGNALDSDHDTFDATYPSTFDHYGQMNFFSLQNMRNLELSYETPMLEKGTMRVAFHMFWIDEPDDDFLYDANLVPRRAAGVLGADSDAGTEIDITFQYPFWNDRVMMLVGYGHYFAGNYIDDTGVEDDDANYFFLQADLKF
ncbi:MAG: alginate export family protein, partial [Myxococcota bacterium]